MQEEVVVQHLGGRPPALPKESLTSLQHLAVTLAQARPKPPNLLLGLLQAGRETGHIHIEERMDWLLLGGLGIMGCW